MSRTAPRANRWSGLAAVVVCATLAGCSATPDLFSGLSDVFSDDAPAKTAQKSPAEDGAAIAAKEPPEEAKGAEVGEPLEAKSAALEPAEAEASPKSDTEAAAAAAARPEMRAAAAAAGPSTAMALSFPEPEACRTVRLYKRPKIRVSKKLPEAWRAFAGHWGDGMWNGKLCQELVIDSISKDGKVTLFDMQGYYTPWKRVPTAFRRTGEFLPDGRLRVDLGKMGVAVFEVRGDKIYGVYDWGVSTARISMIRKGDKYVRPPR